MTKTPPPTPIPSTLEWDLWLGTAASRPFTAGDQEYKDFVAARSAARRAGMPARGEAPAAAGGTPPPGGAGQAGRGGGMGNDDFGYYLPFNWRGFYDFRQQPDRRLGRAHPRPANWGLFLSPEYLVSVECIKKDGLPPNNVP